MTDGYGIRVEEKNNERSGGKVSEFGEYDERLEERKNVTKEYANSRPNCMREKGVGWLACMQWGMQDESINGREKSFS